MLKKLGIFSLLALVIIPAGAMAAGYRAGGAGNGGIIRGGQQSGKQSDVSQYCYCNQNGMIEAQTREMELLPGTKPPVSSRTGL